MTYKPTDHITRNRLERFLTWAEEEGERTRAGRGYPRPGQIATGGWQEAWQHTRIARWRMNDGDQCLDAGGDAALVQRCWNDAGDHLKAAEMRLNA